MAENRIGRPRRGRETFSSAFAFLMTMIGVAVGLGNVWRFPYMVGEFGGAAFVLFYLVMVIFIGVPALMAEWTLGRFTRKGTWGAFEKGGFPGGKYVGLFFIFAVFCGAAYYGTALGWVTYHALSSVARLFGFIFEPSAVLPPEQGIDTTSLTLQILMTGGVILGSAVVLVKGLRKGIEKVSKIFMPMLFVLLIILIIRSVTLPGAGKGLEWYIGSFSLKDLTPGVMAAALGQVVFSLSLGGTFMVVYGSYLDKDTSIPKNALVLSISDMLAGLMAGFVIFPAVFALGLEPDSGPGLIFSTLPKTFAAMPAGNIFAAIFFCGLFAAAFLSLMAGIEVLTAGIMDNTKLSRKKTVIMVSSVVFLLSIPPMINMKVFIPWDLVFGAGMQTLGALLAVITTAWCIKKSDAIKEMIIGGGSSPANRKLILFLYWWMRFVIPLAILFVGLNWLLESVLNFTIFK